MTVVPVDQASNPWITDFAILATVRPHGSSPAHDAFRSSLLALASSDRDHRSLVALGTGEEHRRRAFKLLELAFSVGELGLETIEADMAVAAGLALALRDVSPIRWDLYTCLLTLEQRG